LGGGGALGESAKQNPKDETTKGCKAKRLALYVKYKERTAGKNKKAMQGETLEFVEKAPKTRGPN